MKNQEPLTENDDLNYLAAHLNEENVRYVLRHARFAHEAGEIAAFRGFIDSVYASARDWVVNARTFMDLV